MDAGEREESGRALKPPLPGDSIEKTTTFLRKNGEPLDESDLRKLVGRKKKKPSETVLQEEQRLTSRRAVVLRGEKVCRSRKG